MKALPGLFCGFLNLLCIGLDIVIFFVVVRFLITWRSTTWLEELNRVGRGLIDALMSHVRRLWARTTWRQLSDKGELLVGLVELSFIRLVLSGIAGLF